MYCIIDTETTGLFKPDFPADAHCQPRLASFAMLAADENCNLICATQVLVRPDGWMMPAEAERIHGLSQDLLERHGVAVTEVLSRYVQEIERGAIIVGHNIRYDAKMMRAELRRAFLPDMFQRTRTICTMNALTDVCQIPSRRGSGFKWPSLSEAVLHCLNRNLHGAHGALHDALAALDLLRWLKQNDLLPQPEPKDVAA